MHSDKSLPMDDLRGAARSRELPPVVYDFDLRFEHPHLIEAFAYWNEIRGTRNMPNRADLRPADMKKFIAHFGLAEVRDAQDGQRQYFVRLAGARIEEVYGPRSQKNLLDGLTPDMAMRWRAPFDLTVERALPLRTCGRVGYEEKFWLEFEELYAPLGDGGTRPTMIYYATAMVGRSNFSPTANKDVVVRATNHVYGRTDEHLRLAEK